jgi:filamentous hemagglutinin
VNGSFTLDVGTLADFSGLNTKLNDSGFAESRRMRVGSGDIVIGTGDTVAARDVLFVADDGAVDVSGTIDASGTRGGNVELWAAKELALRNGAGIDASASGTDERGGSVLLATAGEGNAALRLEAGATINVAGTQATESGYVHLRAPRVDTDNDGVTDRIAVGDLNATITGAERVDVEAFSVKSLATGEGIAGTSGFDTTIPAGERNRLAAQLIGANPGLGQQVFHVLPGVEIRTPDKATALDISGTLDLSGSDLRAADGEPGVLTIRSAGDFNVNGSISDGFTDATPNGALFADGDSWSYRLIAGADLDSAHATALGRDGAGDFRLGAGMLIRTGTGSIDVAAAGDIVLTDQKSVIYTAGHDAPTLTDNEFQVPVEGRVSRWRRRSQAARAPATSSPPLRTSSSPTGCIVRGATARMERYRDI